MNIKTKACVREKYRKQDKKPTVTYSCGLKIRTKSGDHYWNNSISVKYGSLPPVSVRYGPHYLPF